MPRDRSKVRPRREIQELLVRCYRFLGDIRPVLHPWRQINEQANREEARQLLDVALALEGDLEAAGVEGMGE